MPIIVPQKTVIVPEQEWVVARVEIEYLSKTSRVILVNTKADQGSQDATIIKDIPFVDVLADKLSDIALTVDATAVVTDKQ